MGYPGGGPFFVGPARVRQGGDISGPDFRNTQTVVRDVYALYGSVRSGNSGGPLFDPEGQVLGVVFASAIDDPNTDRKSTRLNSSHANISYAVFCLKKKKKCYEATLTSP